MQHVSSAAQAPAAKQYLFVDAVRFWCMLGIVGLHTLMIHPDPDRGILPYAVECLLKFGTIGFFLISGFLLGDRMDTSQPLPYLSRRLRILFVPWAFWFALYVVYLIPGDIAHHRLVVHSTASWLYRIRFDLWLAAFSSAFWFVPNLAVGMCILVVFRRHLRSLRLGVALFIVNFVYVANIYAEWFPPVHTTAVFAFVSFLWLGSFASGNFSRISRLMDRVPVVVVAVLTGLSYALCVVETKILVARHSVDPFNTLRLSNQIFSILVVLLLLKIKTASWPSFINVREQTYAIYLIHTFFQRIGRSFMEHGLRPGFVEGAGPAMSFLLSSFSFIFGYGASWLMARWIANSDGWRWTIGLKPREIPGQNRKHQAIENSGIPSRRKVSGQVT